MVIRRLNMDSSWHFEMPSGQFIMDPWLVGSEIDGFKWLNEQWHVVEPVAPKDLPNYDFIVITQSYEDHCHLETLSLLDPVKPILATQKAYKRLRSKFGDRQIHLIPHDNSWLEWGGLKFTAFRPARLLDPIYFALAIKDQRGEVSFYAPHGFTLSDTQMSKLQGQRVDLLITTFTDFRLPEILGGHVNPGIENAMLLHQQLNPLNVINTHDEPKKMKGLVARSAKVVYPDYESLVASPELNFIHIENYEPVEFST